MVRTMNLEDRMLNEAIKAYRITNDMTQQELAERLGCDRVTVSHYEAGRVTPPLYMAQKIAGVFGITVDKLLNYVPEAPSASRSP